MKIYEYQARDMLESAGIAVPAGFVASSPAEAAMAFRKLGAKAVAGAVVKAQVHAGGRGKAGGVKRVRSEDEARAATETILSRPLVTPQTGPAGVPVRKVLVVEAVAIACELYLAVTMDRRKGAPVVIASAQGGVDIEQVAATTPQAIVREPVSPLTGLAPYQGRKVASRLGLRAEAAKQVAALVRSLVELYLKLDATVVEVNPLVVTQPGDGQAAGKVVALDAKMSFDDSAVFRHPQMAALAEAADEEPAEKRAKKAGLSYVKLDGTIGCLVNGAGLAMATMDLIKLHGGQPANFLDVGGSADQEAVTEAFRIIMSDTKVKAVMVNIFGGIMRCDVIAGAIVAAAKDVGFRVPLVVRLQGTNVELARQVLDEARPTLPTLRTADDLTEAAELVTRLAAAGRAA